MKLSFFAPKTLLTSVPPVLGIVGILLSRPTKVGIGFVCPTPLQIMWAVLVGLAIPLVVTLGARIFAQLRWFFLHTTSGLVLTRWYLYRPLFCWG